MSNCSMPFLNTRTHCYRSWMSLTVAIAASCCLFLSGCGGEDMSQPPSAIAERLAKQKAEGKKPDPPAAKPDDKATAPPADSLLSRIQAGEEQAADAKASPDGAAPPATDKAAELANTAATRPEGTPAGEAMKSDTAASGDAAAASKPDAMQADKTAATTSSAPAVQMADPTPAEPTKTTQTSEPAPGTTLDRAAGAAVEGEVVTAGGKTAEQVRKGKETNDSVASAGLSLLDKLKVPDKKPAKPTGRRRGRQKPVITRTGRFAIAAQTWLKLRTDLARRFFVAATDDARRIAASSGQRSLGVLSTQVEVLGKEISFTRTTNNVLTHVRDKQEITTQPVTNLPGTVHSLELIQNGDVVLIGTEDGRILARSSATLQDWDLYSQDLFAFQDEHRPAARVADSEVMLVKAVNAEHLLTVASKGVCRGWSMSDVVPPLKSPLEMTEQEVRQQQTEVLEPTPLFEVQIPDSRIISFSFSESHDLCAIVTSNEVITILETRTGKIVTTLESDFLNDTQPVCVVIQEQPQHVLVGLADGRIFRRAFGTAPPLTGIDEKGLPVDYQIVFAPDLGDNAGAITALTFSDQERLLWIGRLDGSVSQFELARKQFAATYKLHRGPVIELRNTAVGVFTIGADRIAKLIPKGIDPRTGKPAVQQTFNLPKDGSLAARVVEESEAAKQDKFTRARNFNREISGARQASPLFGIRPADPVAALYEHRLRVTTDEDQRMKIREQIKRLRPSGEPAPDSTTTADTEVASKESSSAETSRTQVSAGSADNDPVNSTASVESSASTAVDQKRAAAELVPSHYGLDDGSLQHVSEVATDLDYSAKPLRRALMSVSNDGTIVAVGQNYQAIRSRGAAPEQSLTVLDTPTGTVLRRWRRLPGLMDLSLDVTQGIVLPTPMSARLNLFNGRFVVEDTGRAITWKRLPDSNVILTGLRGVNGLATDSMSLVDLDSMSVSQGLEGFEGVVTALAPSADARSVFVNLRERTTIKLLEIDPRRFEVIQEIVSEFVSGTWQPTAVDLQKGQLGATHILPSDNGSVLVTYGNHPQGGHQLRIWKRSGGRSKIDANGNDVRKPFRHEDVVVIRVKEDIIERQMTSTPFQFVKNEEKQLAVIGPEGLGVLDLENGRPVGNIPLPSVNGRRPVSMLTSDGQWFLAGDLEGQVWVWDLTRLENLPSSLQAHAGPIAGLAMSPNGQFLVTAGEENRIRVWRSEYVLKAGPRRVRSR